MPSNNKVKEGFTLVYTIYADFSQAPWQATLKASCLHLFRPIIEFYCIWASFILKRTVGVGRNMIPNQELNRTQRPVNIDLTKVDPKDIKISVEPVKQ